MSNTTPESNPPASRIHLSHFTNPIGEVLQAGDRVKVANRNGNTLKGTFIFDRVVIVPGKSIWLDCHEERYDRDAKTGHTHRGTKSRSFDIDKVTLHDDTLKKRTREERAAKKASA